MGLEQEKPYTINVLIQRCLGMNVDLYICCIDFEKAFDKIRHQKLLEFLRIKNLGIRDICIIRNIYYNQTANIRVDNESRNGIKICRGVQYGCVLSALLFNLYSEEIFKKVLEEEKAGEVISGSMLNNVRYADDTVILTKDIGDLQQFMDRTNAVNGVLK